MTTYKSDGQIIEKFGKKFPFGVMAGHDGDLDCTDEVKHFLLSQRKDDREALREWAERYAPYDELAEEEYSGAYEYHAKRKMAQDLLSFISNLEEK
jgi:hypothetical protein